MKLKVIKAIKGLVPGDILECNDKYDLYEIYKEDGEVTENTETTKTIKVSIGSWLVKDFKDYLQYIDDNGNPIELEELTYKDSPTYEKEKEVANQNDSISQTMYETLNQKISSLEKQLEEYKSTSKVDNFPVAVYRSPFRTFWSW